MDWIKLTERREAGHRQIIIGSEYIKIQTSNTPWTREDFNVLTRKHTEGGCWSRGAGQY